MVVAVSELALKLLLNRPLLKIFGLPGLALVTSLMYACGLLLLVAAFNWTRSDRPECSSAKRHELVVLMRSAVLAQ